MPPLPATSAGATLVDEEFLHGNDYAVPLTSSRRKHYHLIFQIHDHANNGHLEVAELSRFIDSMGRFSIAELHEMISLAGIDEEATARSPRPPSASSSAAPSSPTCPRQARSSASRSSAPSTRTRTPSRSAAS